MKMNYRHHCLYCDRHYDISIYMSNEDIREELERLTLKKQNEQINKPILEEISQVEARLKHLKSKLR